MARSSEEKSERAAKALLGVAAKDVAHEAERWLMHLASERHLSPATLEVYARDVASFLVFLSEHLGGKPSLASLMKLEPTDVRAMLRVSAVACSSSCSVRTMVSSPWGWLRRGLKRLLSSA